MGGTIVQSGPIVQFHCAAFFENGVAGDGGAPGTPFASALGIFGGSETPFSISSQVTPGVFTDPYAQFSVTQTDTITSFNFSGLNGQSAPSLQFNFNGTIFQFPFGTGSGGNATITLVTSTGSTSLGAFSQVVAIKTASAVAVNIVLPPSASFPGVPATALSAPIITVKDAYQNASTGLISVTAADGKLIDGFSTYTMPINLQAADFVLLGTSWMVK